MFNITSQSDNSFSLVALMLSFKAEFHFKFAIAKVSVFRKLLVMSIFAKPKVSKSENLILASLNLVKCLQMRLSLSRCPFLGAAQKLDIDMTAR